jgi:hypothetical protein
VVFAAAPLERFDAVFLRSLALSPAGFLAPALFAGTLPEPLPLARAVVLVVAFLELDLVALGARLLPVAWGDLPLRVVLEEAEAFAAALFGAVLRAAVFFAVVFLGVVFWAEDRVPDGFLAGLMGSARYQTGMPIPVDRAAPFIVAGWREPVSTGG